MNIFALHETPEQSAIWHTDKHVVKMILETAQMLCTVYWYYGHNAPYNPTHIKHPCVLWAKENASNYRWLVNLGLELCKEYNYRYNKTHKSFHVINEVKNPPYNMEEGFITPFAKAMPDDLKIDDPVLSYQLYYLTKKILNANWTKRDVPDFVINIDKDILFHIYYNDFIKGEINE